MTLNASLSADLSGFRRLQLALAGEPAQRAVADALTSVAFDAQRALKAATFTEMDGPTPFTQRAFGVEKAKAGNVNKVEAVVFVRPIQAEYLKLPILGGVRQAGDIGTLKGGPLVPSGAEVTPEGNFPRGPIRYTGKKLQAGGKAGGAYFKPLDGAGRTAGLFGRASTGGQGLGGQVLLGVIKDRITYKATFPFVATIDKVFAKNFDKYITANLSKLKNKI